MNTLLAGAFIGFLEIVGSLFGFRIPQPPVSLPAAPSTGSQVTTQIWFQPGEDETTEARQGLPQNDFNELFASPESWQQALSGVQVLEIGNETLQVSSASQLKAVISFLQVHHLALGINAEMLPDGPNGCGGSEGYAPNPVLEAAKMAEKIKSLGGTLQYVTMDEPLWYGHEILSLKRNGVTHTPCQYTIAQVASYTAQTAAAFKSVFPNVAIGESEPVGGISGMPQTADHSTNEWLEDIQQFAQDYQADAGEPLAFFHADLLWNTSWQQPLQEVASWAAADHIPLGIFYNGYQIPGNPNPSNAAYVQTVISRYQDVESSLGIIPAQGIITQWGGHLQITLLPETSSSALTYALNQYEAWVKKR